MGSLNAKQEAFCREYIIDLNATQAAIRAGYSAKTVNRTGSYLLSNPDIQAFIADLMAKRNQGVEVNANYVLNRLVEIDQMDVADILTEDGSLKPIKDWPKVWRTTLSGLDVMTVFNSEEATTESVLKKIKWPDKVKNLELLGKHVNVNAFAEKKQESGNEDLAESISKLIDRLPS